MTLVQRLLFMIVISSILLVLFCSTEAAPPPADYAYDVSLKDKPNHDPILDIDALEELAHNDPGFRSNIYPQVTCSF
ncbi:uncharacterized protein TNIN_274331 [Trichonephila inaurata madagascariensis]|uniref:Uncharacterized protein n=1 Tax=Trichonephila inaurata madagascariensis TaxID=2747483 RepID=A0A8X6Y9K4_9ARAC|nr:uncharacterized protein TNIN_274331 [Trichonephila inaurata madagascariensis]